MIKMPGDKIGLLFLSFHLYKHSVTFTGHADPVKVLLLKFLETGLLLFHSGSIIICLLNANQNYNLIKKKFKNKCLQVICWISLYFQHILM